MKCLYFAFSRVLVYTIDNGYLYHVRLITHNVETLYITSLQGFGLRILWPIDRT
jgi:hypothetical protein